MKAGRLTPIARAAADPTVLTVLTVLVLAMVVRPVDPYLADVLVRCCWKTDTGTKKSGEA